MRRETYHSASILLHWLIALAIFWMLASGAAMEYAPLPQAVEFQLYQWHKASGVLVLLAVILRVGVRGFTVAPELPGQLPTIEKRAAKLGHLGLYALMIALPLSGWVMVSASVYGLPTMVFGWFEWPHIPGIAQNEAIEELAEEVHFWLAIAIGAMVLMHVGAVVKHYVHERLNLIPRMWWGRSMPVWLPVVVVLGFSGWVGYHLQQIEPGAPAASAVETVDETAFELLGAGVQSYQLLKEESRIGFSGTHAGNPFSGEFTRYEVEILFGASDLENSKLTARFDMQSAQTGDSLYDGTLPEADWFNVQQYPEAAFVSSELTREESGAFRATGVLTMRGISHPSSFTFRLSPLDENRVKATGSLTLDRLAYEIGKKSDPDAEWVSRNIDITLEIVAQPETEG